MTHVKHLLVVLLVLVLVQGVEAAVKDDDTQPPPNPKGSSAAHPAGHGWCIMGVVGLVLKLIEL